MLLVRESQKGDINRGARMLVIGEGEPEKREIVEPECLLLVRESQKGDINRGARMLVIGEGEP